MRKLWVYGCSFSDYYMPDKVETFWFELLAKKFHLQINHRAVSGIGWRRIKSKIDSECLQWDPEDLIIISPSLFSRVDIPEFSLDGPLDHLEKENNAHKWIRYIEPIDLLSRYYEEDWYHTVSYLHKINTNVWTWTWDSTIYTDVHQLIPPPDTFESWSEWNKEEKQYWVIPYPHICDDKGTVIPGDTHFNTSGHKFIGAHMLNYIKYENSSML